MFYDLHKNALEAKVCDDEKLLESYKGIKAL
jgi:hypothetical protein